MQIVPAETSLVIAGAWNVAILTPDWVLKHGLQKKGEERVQVFFPAGPGLVFEFPRYALEDFSFVVRPDALILSPPGLESSKLEIVEDAAANMLDVLKHTPVTGVGHNFEFRDENSSPQHLGVFTAARQDIADSIPSGWSPAASTLASSFTNEGGKVIVTINRIFDANTVILKFNFHHPVSSVPQALQILRGQDGYARMSQNLEMARQLIKSLYGDTNDN
jgi:hypothetical protein